MGIVLTISVLIFSYPQEADEIAVMLVLTGRYNSIVRPSRGVLWTLLRMRTIGG
jgi:hypothetical protein